MKKTIVKSVLAATMLFSMVLGNGEGVVAATTPSTKAPVMMDNLSKYGLKKDVELPVTVTAGGLSYTLEKIMIYDFNSKEATALRKTYKYSTQSGLIENPKYFAWTKITVKNKGKKTVDNLGGEKWTLSFKGYENLDPVRNFSRIGKTNDKSALNRLVLKPGEQLTTYQAFMYEGSFEYFLIQVFNNGQYGEAYVVER
ncbi:MAG: hypothetical protein K6T94_01230 [Paenibacillus sp.]|nr:hypothetical protein [Paenibacillus sp.]